MKIISSLSQLQPYPELFSFFEQTPDWVCVAGKDGYFRSINQAVADALQYPREEIMSRRIADFIHPDDKEITAARRKKLLEGEALLNFDNRYISATGNIIWLQWSSIYFPDKEVVFAIAKDVTHRKKAELAVEEKYQRFQHLTRHFKTSLEMDKRTLATELHEDLAQMMAVVKMEMGLLRQEQGLAAPARERLDRALSVMEVMVTSVQRMSYAISPAMLDDVGLNETLQWLCNEFTRQHGTPCFFESAVEDGLLSREVQVDLYRICQEALNNVSRHADANSVSVTLAQQEERVCLRIVDDGRGFDVRQTQNTIGMTAMAGRAASINGLINVRSQPGAGTEVSVSLA